MKPDNPARGVESAGAPTGPHKQGEPINVELDYGGEVALQDMTQRTTAVLGTKGAGKTVTISVCVEQLAEHEVRYILLDPIGAMKKKEREKERGSPAREAYFCTELNATNGKQIAELVCQPNMRGFSWQFDLSALDQPDRIAFVEGLSEGLLLYNKEDLIVIMDECQNFFPARYRKGQVAGKGHAIRLISEGRNKDIGIILASQRIGKVDVDVRDLVDSFVFHKLINDEALEAVEKMLKHQVTSKEELQAILSRIQQLGTGQIYFFNPAALNPHRNKGEKKGKPEMQEAQHIEATVQPPGGQEAMPETGVEAAAKGDKEVEVEDAGKAIPPENLPPTPRTDLFNFDQALIEGKVAEARWDAGKVGQFRTLGVVKRVTKEHFHIAIHNEVQAGKAAYPIGHILRLPRYAKPTWSAVNGVFPLPSTGKAGDPEKVFEAAKVAAQEQGLGPKDSKDVAAAARTAAEGRYKVVAETAKGRKVAREAIEQHDSAMNAGAAEFTQRLIASEPAAAQTHSTKHGRPGNEVYADDDFSAEQLHHLAVHEWTEEHGIRKGLTQQQAHAIANAAERANAGDHVFESGVVEAQQVAEKARQEVGLVWKQRPDGHYESGKVVRRKDGSRRFISHMRTMRSEGKGTLPPRTYDTMSDAISMSSPSGHVSKRSQRAARSRLGEALFGDYQPDGPPQPSKVESLRRTAKQLRSIAEAGMKPRAYRKRADMLDAQADAIERAEGAGKARGKPLSDTEFAEWEIVIDRALAVKCPRCGAEADQGCGPHRSRWNPHMARIEAARDDFMQGKAKQSCAKCGKPATRFIADAFFCDAAACEPGRTASGRYGKAGLVGYSHAALALVRARVRRDSQGGLEPIEDDAIINHSALDAAIERTQHGPEYGEDDVFWRAAFLVRGIVTEHAYSNGNKRTGLVAMDAYLGLNNVGVEATQVEREHLMLRAATGEADLETIAEWLRHKSLSPATGKAAAWSNQPASHPSPKSSAPWTEPSARTARPSTPSPHTTHAASSGKADEVPGEACPKRYTYRRSMREVPEWRPCAKSLGHTGRHGAVAEPKPGSEWGGTCQCCFKGQQTNHNLLVLHGYRRPGYGYIEGRCWGVNYAPFEVSCDRTKQFIAEVLQPTLARWQENLARLQAKPDFIAYEARVYVGYEHTTRAEAGYKHAVVDIPRDAPGAWFETKFPATERDLSGMQSWFREFERQHGRPATPGLHLAQHPSYADSLERAIHEQEGRIAHIRLDIAYFERKVAEWRPVPWPRARGKADDLSPHMAKALTDAREGGGLRYLRGGFWVRSNSLLDYGAYETNRKELLAEGYHATHTVKALHKRGLIQDARTPGARFMDRATIAEPKA